MERNPTIYVTDTRETISDDTPNSLIFDDLYDRHKAGEMSWDEMMRQYRQLAGPQVAGLALGQA